MNILSLTPYDVKCFATLNANCDEATVNSVAFHFLRRIMNKLNFYDVDEKYIEYLKNIEIESRGFTCVPNIIYSGERKFLCLY